MAAPYSEAFEKAIAFILPHEEEFARGHWGDENFVIAENVDGDSGGVTKYGIDASSHPTVNVADLTRAQAIDIYFNEWTNRNLDALPEKFAVAMFDVYVNGGQPALWLQHAINLVASTARVVAEDGQIGPQTIAAAAACNQAAVLYCFIKERDARFRLLAESPARAKFLDGWEQRDTDLAAYLSA